MDYRVEAAAKFDEAIDGFPFLIRQQAPEGATNSWWAYTLVLDTEQPEVDWFRFREMFLENGGDDVYACWKLSAYSGQCTADGDDKVTTVLGAIL